VALGAALAALRSRLAPAASRPAPALPARVSVGIGVLVVDPDSRRFLVGLRKGSHGSEQWALPGGWLEQKESFKTCALREIHEEAGLAEDDFTHAEVMDIAPSNNCEFNTASVFVLCWLKPGLARKVAICEPDKCYEWRWINSAADLDHAPPGFSYGPGGPRLFRPLAYLFDERPELLKLALATPPAKRG